MKMNIVYTFQARQDLKNIYEYIAYSLLAPDAAHSTCEKILQAARSLESMPEKILSTRKNLGAAKVCVLYR